MSEITATGIYWKRFAEINTPKNVVNNSQQSLANKANISFPLKHKTKNYSRSYVLDGLKIQKMNWWIHLFYKMIVSNAQSEMPKKHKKRQAP